MAKKKSKKRLEAEFVEACDEVRSKVLEAEKLLSTARERALHHGIVMCFDHIEAGIVVGRGFDPKWEGVSPELIRVMTGAYREDDDAESTLEGWEFSSC